MTNFKIIVSIVEFDILFQKSLLKKLKSSCIFIIAKNLDPSKIQFGVGVVSIN